MVVPLCADRTYILIFVLLLYSSWFCLATLDLLLVLKESRVNDLYIGRRCLLNHPIFYFIRDILGFFSLFHFNRLCLNVLYTMRHFLLHRFEVGRGRFNWLYVIVRIPTFTGSTRSFRFIYTSSVNLTNV